MPDDDGEPEHHANTQPRASGGSFKEGKPASVRERGQSAFAKVKQAMTPGLYALGESKHGIQSLLLPTSKSPENLARAVEAGKHGGCDFLAARGLTPTPSTVPAWTLARSPLTHFQKIDGWVPCEPRGVRLLFRNSTDTAGWAGAWPGRRLRGMCATRQASRPAARSRRRKSPGFITGRP